MSKFNFQTCQVVTKCRTLFTITLRVDMLLLQNFIKFLRNLLGFLLILCLELCQGLDSWTCSSIHNLFDTSRKWYVSKECIRDYIQLAIEIPTFGITQAFSMNKNYNEMILTCFQWRLLPIGSFFHLFTSKTHALHISPLRCSSNWKHFTKSSSYFLLSVNLELLDLALQIQQPVVDRYTFGLWKLNILAFATFLCFL